MKKKVFLLLLSVIAFARVEEERDRLFKIQDEIKKIEDSLKLAKERKEKTQSKIGEVSSNKEKHKKELIKTEQDIKRISKRIDITEQRIAGLKAQIKSKKDGLSFVVKELWLSHTLSSFFNQSQEKENCLNILINDLCLSIEGREIEKRNEIAKKQMFGVVLAKTEKEKRETVSNIKKAEREIVLQNKALQKIKEDETALQKKIARLKQDQKRLEALIVKLEKQRKGLPKETKPVGSLIWPIKSRNIVRPFGRYTHPEAKTILINKGIDISAPLGSPVFAVADGEVVYADWFMGYGNLIMIDHNGSLYSLYANLLEMNVEIKDKVTKGQIIGSVGKSKETESPILHFEIRLNGEASDPMDWLG